MPNLIANILTIHSDIRIPELFVNGEMTMDFNKIIPMPPDLDITEGSENDKDLLYYLTKRCTIPIKALSGTAKDILDHAYKNTEEFRPRYRDELFLNVMTDMYEADQFKSNKAYTHGQLLVQNYQKYGHTTWYGWRIENWGTKWNANNAKPAVGIENAVAFVTAWDTPAPILFTLCQKYPDVKMSLTYASEERGYDSGKIEAVFESSRVFRDLSDLTVKKTEYEPKGKDAYATYELCTSRQNISI